VTILYFAWLRARIGMGQEHLSPPADIATVGQLLDWLRGQSPAHAEALANPALLRAAVNQDLAGWDHPVQPGDEVAFFPPVTGG
jgi:molybdopterin converting factor subunit 1